jgi:hypothetical protein
MLKQLSRRTVIRGAAGAVIALPLLDAMAPRHARAQGAVPKRFVLWYTAGGQMPAYWFPTGTETNFTLNTAHKPLEPYKSKIIVFDGVNNDASKEPIYGGHQGSFAAMISGMPHTGVGFDVMRPTGPSIDQLVADKIGGTTKIKSLQTGVQNPGGGGNNPFVRIGSWRGEKELLPAIGQPGALFDYMFASGAPTGGVAPNPMAAENLRKRRKSILDAVSGRFTTLKARVGTADKVRLDNHLTSIREIEGRVLMAQSQAACMLPTRPMDGFTTRTSDVPMWGKLMMDLMVLGLACDVTRVTNFMWGGMGGAGTATWLGHTTDHHNLAHANALKEMTEWNTWYSTQLAYLMSALEKYPDVGGGTMLDNTLIMWWNELGNGSAHTSNRAPFVLAGGAGGALKMGRFLNYTPAIQNGQILLSVYNVLTGSQDKVFGSPKYCPGPAPGLV